MSRSSHPAWPPACRYDTECGAPPLVWLQISYDQHGAPILVTVRPIATGSRVGAPVCVDHMQFAIDESVMASLPVGDPGFEDDPTAPRLVEVFGDGYGDGDGTDADYTDFDLLPGGPDFDEDPV